MKLRTLLLAAMAVFTLASCGDKDHDPEIILPSVPYALLPGVGGKVDVGLDCTGEWVVTTKKDSWITVTPQSGKGNGTVTFSAEENTTGKERKEYVNLNEQQFSVIQTINIKIGDIVGEWATKENDYIFTFNPDKTCNATMTRGEFAGTYAVTGNIIKITVTGMPKTIDVVVNEIIDGTTMRASVAGTELELKKIIRK